MPKAIVNLSKPIVYRSVEIELDTALSVLLFSVLDMIEEYLYYLDKPQETKSFIKFLEKEEEKVMVKDIHKLTGKKLNIVSTQT